MSRRIRTPAPPNPRYDRTPIEGWQLRALDRLWDMGATIAQVADAIGVKYARARRLILLRHHDMTDRIGRPSSKIPDELINKVVCGMRAEYNTEIKYAKKSF